MLGRVVMWLMLLRLWLCWMKLLTRMLVHAGCNGTHLLAGMNPMGTDGKWIWYTAATTTCPSRTGIIITFSLFLLIYCFDGFHLFFDFNSAVLKPNLDLTFCQAESMSNFNASAAGQVVVKVEFFFQFQCLEPSIASVQSPSLSLAGGSRLAWKRNNGWI